MNKSLRLSIKLGDRVQELKIFFVPHLGERGLKSKSVEATDEIWLTGNRFMQTDQKVYSFKNR